MCTSDELQLSSFTSAVNNKYPTTLKYCGDTKVCTLDGNLLNTYPCIKTLPTATEKYKTQVVVHEELIVLLEN